MYFECKLRYDKIQENGAVKKVTEAYLVDALSFTEAEARIIKEMTPYISGDSVVTAIRKTKIAEIFVNEDDERWYIVKTAFISLDEKSGKEKKTISQILVGASNPDEAMERHRQGMKGTMADYEIAGINETAYMDVFPTVKA